MINQSLIVKIRLSANLIGSLNTVFFLNLTTLGQCPSISALGECPLISALGECPLISALGQCPLISALGQCLLISALGECPLTKYCYRISVNEHLLLDS